MASEAGENMMTVAVGLMKKMTGRGGMVIATVQADMKRVAEEVRALREKSPEVANATLGLVDMMIESGAIQTFSDVSQQIRELGASLGSVEEVAPTVRAPLPEPVARQVERTAAPKPVGHRVKQTASDAQAPAHVVAGHPASKVAAHPVVKAAAGAAVKGKAAKSPDLEAPVGEGGKKLFGAALKSYRARVERGDPPVGKSGRKKVATAAEPVASVTTTTHEDEGASAVRDESDAVAKAPETRVVRETPPVGETGRRNKPETDGKAAAAGTKADQGRLSMPGEQRPAVEIRDSVQKDYLICLEDGERMKMLKRHIRTAYGLSPEDYRAKWGLPDDYPMVAPNYAKQKSRYAKSIGLGSARMRQEVASKRQSVEA